MFVCIFQLRIVTIYLVLYLIVLNTSHAINLTFAELEYSTMKSLSGIDINIKFLKIASTNIRNIVQTTTFNNNFKKCATILSVLITASGLLG